MKKIFIFICLCVFCISVAFSQNGEYTGGNFIKKIENNLSPYGKENVDKLFFGEFNASLEFLFAPSSEAVSRFGSPCGFRIIRDSSNSHILEIKCISNYKEALKEAGNRHRSIGIPAELMLRHLVPKDIDSLIDKHNEEVHKKYLEELPKLYMVEASVFHISKRFAEKLYEKTVSFIDNFNKKRILSIPPMINPADGYSIMCISDGYSATFRTAVEDEVWTLHIQEPDGNALKMSNLFRQIIADADANNLNESKYIEELDKIK